MNSGYAYSTYEVYIYARKKDIFLSNTQDVILYNKKPRLESIRKYKRVIWLVNQVEMYDKKYNL